MLPQARYQRCMVHFMRNVLSKVPPTHREWASAALMLICARIRYVTVNDWSSRRYLDMSRLDGIMQSTDERFPRRRTRPHLRNIGHNLSVA